MRSKEYTPLTKISENEELLKVIHSGLVRLQYFEDNPDGNLAIGEILKNIPFKIERFFFINSLHNPDAIRGKHAHYKSKQIIFGINGSFTLNLDDGYEKQTIRVDTPYVGVVLDGMIWHEMREFSQDCVILVVADAPYDKKDYIRDYYEFLRNAG